jgi:hypothetical protein
MFPINAGILKKGGGHPFCLGGSTEEWRGWQWIPSHWLTNGPNPVPEHS